MPEIHLKIRKPFLIAAIVVLAVSLSLLAWCRWPLPTKQQALTLSLDKLTSIYPGSQLPDFLKQEGRQLVLVYPQEMRQGETGQISLRWEPITKPSSGTGSSVSGNVLVETRLDLLQFYQTPSDEIIAPLVSGESFLIQWRVTPTQAGSYTGTIWSYLNLGGSASASSSASSNAGYDPVAVQNIQIQVDNLLGLSYPVVLWSGWIGCGLALVLVSLALIHPKKNLRRRRASGKRKNS